MVHPVYHVAPAGEHWEVEDEGGKMIAEAETKEQAIEAAQEASAGKASIVIHTADGVVEREIAKPAHKQRTSQ